MNYFQLVIKQMRQRALSTWLTLLSVMLGVGLAIAIMVLGRESKALFGQTDYGFDVLVGAKGSGLQLTINTIYHLDVSPGNIPYEVFSDLSSKNGALNKYVKIAIPTVVGDTYQGKYRIVGTTPNLFGIDGHGKPLPPDEVMDYRPGEKYEMMDGHVFSPTKFEAIVGSRVAELTGLKVGSTFQATHGIPAPGTKPDIHPQTWTVVGILKPTHTASDSVLYIPLLSFYTIAEHGVGLMAQEKIRQGESPDNKEADVEFVPTTDAAGIEHFKNYDINNTEMPQIDKSAGGITIQPHNLHITLDPNIWALSAIMVQSKGGFTGSRLLYEINFGKDAMAVTPAQVMRDFFDTFLKPIQLLLVLICSLVTVVAAVGILVSIYNSVSARLKEIAILRALGATRTTVLSLICLEAGLIALIGSIAGLICGHIVCWAGSIFMQQRFGEVLNWSKISWWEPVYVVGVIVLALLAGLVPAFKAYRTPVATNLVAG